MTSSTTLSVDCGGGGIKASVLDVEGAIISRAVRTATPYPLPPTTLVETIASLAGRLPTADRVTVGMPGVIRHGVVIATPHYITRDGPRSKVLPELVEAWARFNMARAIGERLGLEMIVPLGTGLGNAVFDNGVLAPHVEVSQGPIRWGLSYDDYIGEHERLRLGDAHWSRRVRRVVDGLRPMYLWDRLYLGGGNSRRITALQLSRMGDDVVVVPNEAGMTGGARCWDMARP